MAIIKCKMCGGDMEIIEGISVAECEYCGTKQTVPNVDNEKKLTLFSRANRLRLACEFDKAASVYENLVAEFPEEAEAYWGLVLCKYGIEYVDDPATGKKIPTCHRSSFESILEDSDFEQACENADMVARKVYREEAKVIEQIRRDILEVSGKEQPYDIFICYKETDENGQRTLDSVLAQDVYDALSEKGYRVFFSRITLEDKLGTQYEPYIFAALNSAKVMLVFGTDYEYFNAVWVKNEWGRFLKLMAKNKDKHLIPCYKNIDAYDMPKEFQKLQSQDMGKVGSTQDLLRGIEKLLKVRQKSKETIAVQQSGGATWEALLERGQMFLEDSDWANANKYFEKVLDIRPKCAEAYVGKLCVDYQCTTKEDLEYLEVVLSQNRNYQKAINFAPAELKRKLEAWNQRACENNKDRLKRSRDYFNKYNELNRYIACITTTIVGLKADGTVVTTDRKLNDAVAEWVDIIDIAYVALSVLVGLKLDGTVVTTNSELTAVVAGWSDIVAIACQENIIAGLKANGTVVTTASKLNAAVADWSDIVAIACQENIITGLKADGTVVTTDSKLNAAVADWSEVVFVANEKNHLVGLKSDGTVVATERMVSEKVKGWSNIISITVEGYNIIGLKSDGTVVTTKTEYVAAMGWSDIVSIACRINTIVGVKSDGTVLAIGGDKSNHVRNWTNIEAVACSTFRIAGLKSDGTVITANATREESLDWKLFKNCNTIEAERKEARQERKRRQIEAERQQQELVRQQQLKLKCLKEERSNLQAELPTIKGLFSGGKRKKVENRLAEIEKELKELN